FGRIPFGIPIDGHSEGVAAYACHKRYICRILATFLIKEQLSDDDESTRPLFPFFSYPLFLSIVCSLPCKSPHPLANAPPRTKRVREDHFGFRSTNLSRRQTHSVRGLSPQSRARPQRPPA